MTPAIFKEAEALRKQGKPPFVICDVKSGFVAIRPTPEAERLTGHSLIEAARRARLKEAS